VRGDVTTLELCYPSRPATVGEARRALSRHPALADGLRDDLALVASEVVANAVMHGSSTPDEHVLIHAEFGPRKVRITVTDGGRGFDPANAPRRAGGGYGLRIVDALAQRWGVTPGSVWFELNT
jgi:anti-sigma regulatory factor (Ser/Thr protein kinase)